MAPPYYSPYSTSEFLLPHLIPRQTTTTTSGAGGTDNGSSTTCTGLSGGAIAGIVIGTIVGTLLLVWAFSQRAAAGGATKKTRTTVVRDEHLRRRRSRSHSHSRSGRPRRPERVYYNEK